MSGALPFHSRLLPRALAALALAALPPGAAAPGTLRVEVAFPSTPEPFLARVEDSQGTLFAMVRANEAGEVPGGTYRVTLLTDPPLERRAVDVPVTGERVVRFGELGGIELRVEGADGAIATAADVLLADGRRVGSVGSASILTLPAGRYRLVVRTRPNRTVDGVLVRAGRVNVVRVGVGATLRVEARGPGGVEVPVRARTRHPDGATLVLEPGERLSLPPGAYDVALETVPPLARSVVLAAGREEIVRVDDLGALRLELRDARGKLVAASARIVDPRSGLVLATAENGESVAVRPGTYRVRFDSKPPRVASGIKVAARRTVGVGGKEHPAR